MSIFTGFNGMDSGEVLWVKDRRRFNGFSEVFEFELLTDFGLNLNFKQTLISIHFCFSKFPSLSHLVGCTIVKSTVTPLPINHSQAISPHFSPASMQFISPVPSLNSRCGKFHCI
jgi:hypothetical protein